MGRHVSFAAQALVEAAQQGTAAGEHDSAIHDVRGELRRRAVERLLDCSDDLSERLLERATHLFTA